MLRVEDKKAKKSLVNTVSGCHYEQQKNSKNVYIK